MGRLRSVIIAVSGALIATAGGLSAGGCGDDTSGVTAPDGGNDVTTDGTGDDSLGSDVTMGMEAATDSPAESGSDASDGAPTRDAGDAGDSSMGDASDASDGDAGPSAAYVFSQSEATAICNVFNGCCPQDAGTFNLSQCVSNLSVYGWEGNLPADPSVYGRANITVDQVKASQCLAAIAGFPCGTQTPAQWATITQACELVLTGTIPIGQSGCISSFECASNSYCDPTVGGGTCEPLRTQGQACNTAISSSVNPIPDFMCSYLGSQQPPLFCDMIDNAPNAATCQPLLAASANCVNLTAFNGAGYLDDQACPTSAPLCGDNSQCGGTTSAPYFFCGGVYYNQDAGVTDAGGGG